MNHDNAFRIGVFKQIPSKQNFLIRKLFNFEFGQIYIK